MFIYCISTTNLSQKKFTEKTLLDKMRSMLMIYYIQIFLAHILTAFENKILILLRANSSHLRSLMDFLEWQGFFYQ